MTYYMQHRRGLLFSALLSALCVVWAGVTSAAPPAKPKVAIMKPSVGEGVSKWSKKYLNLSTILDEIEASIQKTRKFELLSRKESVLKSIRREQEFAKSDLAEGDAAPEGQIKNANYQVIPVVQDFKFYRSSKPVPNLANKYFRTDHGVLEMNVQVVDVATGAIKTTFYMKDSFNTKRHVVNSKDGAPNSQYFTGMAKAVSAQMADQLVNVVFPMKVLNVQGDQMWINRGTDGGLSAGDLLKVFRPGVELIDPDTGESLGSAETEIGKVKVQRVNPKFTIVVGVDLSEPAMKDDIVRKP